MKLTGNTIFITGGGSGIGRGLAEALHARGNRVIISGRDAGRLAVTTSANPGMASIAMDVEQPDSIAAAARRLTAEHPALNVLINNAGIMLPDDAAGTLDDTQMVSIITTNLMGPIRMSAALIDHLKAQPAATIVNVTSILGFTPLALTSVYSSTKAAMHSYTLSQRYKLRGTAVEVLELAPPWVATTLMNSQDDLRAMPLDRFIALAMAALETAETEVLVEEAKALRNNAGPGEGALVEQFNDLMMKTPVG